MPVLRCLHLRMFYNHFLGKKFVEAKVTDIAASKDNTYGVSSFKLFQVFNLVTLSLNFILWVAWPATNMNFNGKTSMRLYVCFPKIKAWPISCQSYMNWRLPELKGYERHYQTFIWHSSGSYQAVITRSSGSYQAVIGQSSGSHKIKSSSNH